MKINKNLDTDQIKKYAAAAIKGMYYDIGLAFTGIDPREFERFADRWADIVTDQIPREYLEQLDNAEAIGRTIGDYTREYRKDHWADFGILVDAINNPQSNMLHMCQVQPSIIPSKVLADIEKCLFEPNIDAYKNIRKFAYEVHHKLIVNRDLNLNLSVPITALEDNIHVITALDRWLVDKAALLVASKYVDVSMDYVPKALYNTIEELLIIFRYNNLINEANGVYQFKRPSAFRYTIDKFFEETVDSVLEKQIKKAAELSAEMKAPYKDPVTHIDVYISKAKWEKLISQFDFGNKVLVVRATGRHEAASNRTIYNAELIIKNGKVEIEYDQDGTLVSTPTYAIYPEYDLRKAFAGLAGYDNP